MNKKRVNSISLDIFPCQRLPFSWLIFFYCCGTFLHWCSILPLSALKLYWVLPMNHLKCVGVIYCKYTQNIDIINTCKKCKLRNRKLPYIRQSICKLTTQMKSAPHTTVKHEDSIFQLCDNSTVSFHSHSPLGDGSLRPFLLSSALQKHMKHLKAMLQEGTLPVWNDPVLDNLP